MEWSFLHSSSILIYDLQFELHRQNQCNNNHPEQCEEDQERAWVSLNAILPLRIRAFHLLKISSNHSLFSVYKEKKKKKVATTAPSLFVSVVQINSITKVIQANESTKELRNITSYTSICFVCMCILERFSGLRNPGQWMSGIIKSQEMNKIIIFLCNSCIEQVFMTANEFFFSPTYI